MDEIPVRAPLLPQRDESLVTATPETGPKTAGLLDNVEVPYTDYETQHGHPLLVDHYGLGDTWNDSVGGYPEELAKIEVYMREKVNSGELADSPKAVQNKIKEFEKFLNLKGEERVSVRLPMLAAHVEFLMKSEGIKRSLNRYGTR